MNILYKETQVGKILIGLIGGSIVGSIYLGYIFGYSILCFGLILFLSFFFLLYSFMRTEVDRYKISITLGWILKKNIDVSEIKEISNFEEPLFYTWGIKPLANGWIYSVDGYKAVKIILRDDTVYVIGTKNPEQLIQTLQSITRNKVEIKKES
ncbi:MAG: hypothetical protein QY330_05340 [Candidatus Dojkabacteria bacterium]|nr:MAG: hypothetical protein QY330_05340 [Candidatus Dojkabacteria bacterium]